MGNQPYLEEYKYWWEVSIGAYANATWLPHYYYHNYENDDGLRGRVLTLDFLKIRLHIVIEKIIDYEKYFEVRH